VRLSEGEALGDLLRVISAGLVVGAPMSVSTGSVLPAEISAFLASQGVTVSLERDDAWLERVSVQGPGDDELAATRVRLIGGDRVRAAEWIGGLGEITLWAEPVTIAGPVELLTFLREQSVSITAHRHGLAFVPAGIGTWLSEIQN
jgi:RHH-type proline utilization regulon transcriptional repressor/proline dehydrogenase/delta 1-pyrroline-5-carboxylate dehydrogenase